MCVSVQACVKVQTKIFNRVVLRCTNDLGVAKELNSCTAGNGDGLL